MAANFVNDQAADERNNPATFQPDADRLAAFRLLVHSEIEEFLESKARERLSVIETLISSDVDWVDRCPEIFILASFYKITLPNLESIDGTALKKYASDVLKEAKEQIIGNNGIKSRSFVFLSICAGKKIDKIDSVLSAGLNSFGKNRGDVAHRSVVRSSTIQAPSTELANVQALVGQIGTYFDVQP